MASGASGEGIQHRVWWQEFMVHSSGTGCVKEYIRGLEEGGVRRVPQMSAERCVWWVGEQLDEHETSGRRRSEEIWR